MTYATTEEAYRAGYSTGRSWDAPWTPGGPYYFSVRPYNSEDVQRRARHSIECNREWLRGWHDGFEVKNGYQPDSNVSVPPGDK